MYSLKEKVKMLKRALKSWNRETFGVLDDHIQSLTNALAKLDKNVENGSYDRQMIEKRREVSTELLDKTVMMESLLKQKSKNK